jgi:hypothetical protein
LGSANDFGKRLATQAGSAVVAGNQVNKQQCLKPVCRIVPPRKKKAKTNETDQKHP